MVQRRSVVIRIELNQKRPGLDVLVVLDLRIDIENGASDASADRIQVAINLSIIGGFKPLGIQPPQEKNEHHDHGSKKQNPSRHSFRPRDWCFGLAWLAELLHSYFSRGENLGLLFDDLYGVRHINSLQRNLKNRSQQLPSLARA